MDLTKLFSPEVLEGELLSAFDVSGGEHSDLRKDSGRSHNLGVREGVLWGGGWGDRSG